MKREYYDEEMMVKEAITLQKNDQEIGMPDIESELKRVKQMTSRTHRTLIGWRRIAAICTLVLSVSGLAWAVVCLQQFQSEDTNAEQTQTTDHKVADTTVQQTADDQGIKVSDQFTLSYDKASLEQIVIDLSAFYHLDQPVFTNKTAARSSKLHVTLNPDADIQDAVALLNQFGSIHIELTENRLVVK